jgi:hypothetical protein
MVCCSPKGDLHLLQGVGMFFNTSIIGGRIGHFLLKLSFTSYLWGILPCKGLTK